MASTKSEKKKIKAEVLGPTKDKHHRVEKKSKKKAKHESSDSEEPEPKEDKPVPKKIINKPHDCTPQSKVAKYATPCIPNRERELLKKTLHTVEVGAEWNCVKRGVKDVAKAVRHLPNSPHNNHPAVCIIAADVFPQDVITHLPLDCEKHNVPVFFVPSRLGLGTTAGMRRSTAVLLVTRSSKFLDTDEGEKHEDDEKAAEVKEKKRKGKKKWPEYFENLVQIASDLHKGRKGTKDYRSIQTNNTVTKHDGDQQYKVMDCPIFEKVSETVSILTRVVKDVHVPISVED